MSGSLRLCLCKSRIGILEVETFLDELSLLSPSPELSSTK